LFADKPISGTGSQSGKSAHRGIFGRRENLVDPAFLERLKSTLAPQFSIMLLQKSEQAPWIIA